MSWFLIKVRIDGYVYYEDPKCPSRWRGSGVYDISVKKSYYAECVVIAKDEDNAISLVNDESIFSDIEFDRISGIEIISCEKLDDSDDEYTEEYIDSIEYKDI